MLENAHTVHIVLILSVCINGVQTASFLDGSLMQDILPVAVQLLLCANIRPCVQFVVSVVEILVWDFL